MGGLARLADGRRDLDRSDFASFTLDEFGAYLQQSGILLQSNLQGRIEQVENSFPGFVTAAYKNNAAVFALEVVRFLLFSEARFQFRQLRNGKPGDLFGTAELAILEKPWQNATTGDMLARLLLYSDFAGNGYAVRRAGRLGPAIRLPRPDWMTIIIGSMDPDADPRGDMWDIDAEIAGYQYHPGGIGVGTPVNLLPESVAHFAPIPDPIARFRGMSWITPCLREVEADGAASNMTLAYFRNGAQPGTIVTINNPAIKDPDDLRKWIELFEQDHRGSMNRYRTLYLANGADAKVVGSNLQEADLSKTRGATQTTLATAAGVPAAIVGFSEGLTGSSLNKGNIQELKRLLADKTFRPLWRNMSGSMSTLVTVPGGSELWTDDGDIKFLAEDVKEAGDVLFVKAQAIKQLTDAGYDSDSVVDAVNSGDLSRLTHTGLFSVQLQAPGSPVTAAPNTPIPPTAQSARARSTFWTSGGFMRGRIIEGTHVPLDSPWVASFPSMFEPSEQAVAITVSRVAPPLLESGIRSDEVRCSACNRMLAERAAPPYRLRCRCGTLNEEVGLRSEPVLVGDAKPQRVLLEYDDQDRLVVVESA